LKDQKVMMLGVFDSPRLPLAPNVPTFKELAFEVTLRSGGAIITARGTPGTL
jgi:tripartite-type tricarboxylate transporter receptor subunit TctC